MAKPTKIGTNAAPQIASPAASTPTPVDHRAALESAQARAATVTRAPSPASAAPAPVSAVPAVQSSTAVATTDPDGPTVIEVTSAAPFKAKGIDVAKIIINPIGFADYVAASQRAAIGMQSMADYRMRLARAQALKQVKLQGAAGATVPLDEIAFAMLPRVYAVRLLEALGGEMGEAGEVLAAGDGITKPVLYRFGMPLETSAGVIDEIEIAAPTMSRIERVLAENGTLAQTLALIEACAKPVDGSLLMLPDWAVKQVSVADGMKIMAEVLPAFLS